MNVSMTVEPPPDLIEKRDRLLDTLRGYESCAVAFSGGVDSAVVAQAAYLALGDNAVAVTAASASLSPVERQAAVELARRIGIRHELIATDELQDPSYARNAPDRCYHCKSELYGRMRQLAALSGQKILANGANLDDQGDYRPGMQAAGEHAVRSPLIDCGINKAEVRQLAAAWQLPVWDKPASPCLSSRIAYGEEVTPGRLAMIDAAEQFLRVRGLPEVRVRYHRGYLARIEVPPSALPQLCADGAREELLAELARLGFKYITLDLAGFRSGSLNDILPMASIQGLSN